MTTLPPGTDLAAAFKALKDDSTLTLSPGAYRGGVTLQGRKNVRIIAHDAIITGGEDALKVFGCEKVTIEGLACVAANQYGFMLQNSKSITLQGCQARGCGTTGILTASTDDVNLLDCLSANSRLQHGAYISQRCQKARIVGGTYEGNMRSGIQVNCDHGGARDIEIRNVICRGNQKAGAAAITLAYVNGGKVLNCSIEQHYGRAGIVLWERSKGIEIDNCRFGFAPGCGQSAIQIDKGSDAKVGSMNVPDPRVPLVHRG